MKPMTFLATMMSAAVVTLTGLPTAADADDAGGRQLVLSARGTAVAYECEIPPTANGTTVTLCFDIPLYNLKSKRVNDAPIGTLTDSLADIQHVDPTMPSRLLAVITSVFKFSNSHSESQLVTRVMGSVQPFTGAEAAGPMTHMTGAIPAANSNSILSGTGRFAHVTSGLARESGAVNLSQFHGHVGDPVTFDLIWTLSLDETENDNEWLSN